MWDGGSGSNQATESRPGAAPLLVIVGRDFPQLYDYLVVRFAEIPGVQIILDRRSVASRRVDASEPKDARDRRGPGGNDELRVRGYLITRGRA